ncbi:MAG: hypothetical protein A2X05_01075 [Bacteroidetes bacterium GWE2_41_25]|nr:MAG: hypothetical protein A2X03_13945 [Bacteroidetes bacterium GWA2_40_15]OFX93771.1 MAG: hypothetical protein A2X05_01075 [Bacteroidetes bacterium GWE2_41_25]OFX98599.1 MAG: hypothetical protein A2X06_01870 [Bacteroidetes bacterium GWC2_40_22]HBH85922.1 hypothetical protein [Bacteroidales bacterium]HBQ83196.1 hypothetical protein [Bacteroidales bacterium]
MNRLWTTVTVILLLLVFIGYMVFDLTMKTEPAPEASLTEADTLIADQWIISKVFDPGKGRLNAVAVSVDGKIILGGESFVACYDSAFVLHWEYKTSMPVMALAFSKEKIYAVSGNIIEVLNLNGEKDEEWGPYGDRSLITSISANDTYVAFADAGDKMIYILDREGVVKHMAGQSEEPFIIPSPYFDVVLGTDNTLYVANTGKRRIERRNIDGTLLDFFGEEGTAPGAFCGCCNPAHFTVIPGGYITAEKGLNRIKILGSKGEFVEAVSFSNKFIPSVPLDIASADGSKIYAANPADSKLYSFKRK